MDIPQIVLETVFLCHTHSWLYILTTGNSTFFTPAIISNKIFLPTPPPSLSPCQCGDVYNKDVKYRRKKCFTIYEFIKPSSIILAP